MLILDKCNIKKGMLLLAENIFRDKIPFEIFNETERIPPPDRVNLQKLIIVTEKEDFTNLDDEFNWCKTKIGDDIVHYELFCILLIRAEEDVLIDFPTHEHISVLAFTDMTRQVEMDIRIKMECDDFYINLLLYFLLISFSENDLISTNSVYTQRGACILYPENNYFIEQLDRIKDYVLTQYQNGNRFVNEEQIAKTIHSDTTQSVKTTILVRDTFSSAENFKYNLHADIWDSISSCDTDRIRKIFIFVKNQIDIKLEEFYENFALVKSENKLVELRKYISEVFQENIGSDDSIIYDYSEQRKSITNKLEKNCRKADSDFDEYKRKVRKHGIFSILSVALIVLLSVLLDNYWFLSGILGSVTYFIIVKKIFFNEFKVMYDAEIHGIKSNLFNQMNKVRESILLCSMFYLQKVMDLKIIMLREKIDQVSDLSFGTRKEYASSDLIKIFVPEQQIEAKIEKRDFLEILHDSNTVSKIALARLMIIREHIKEDFINARFDENINHMKNVMPKLRDDILPYIFAKDTLDELPLIHEYCLFAHHLGGTSLIEQVEKEFSSNNQYVYFLSLLKKHRR
jgi:hypothetical protein